MFHNDYACFFLHFGTGGKNTFISFFIHIMNKFIDRNCLLLTQVKLLHLRFKISDNTDADLNILSNIRILSQ